MSLAAGLSSTERATFASMVTQQSFGPGETMVAAGLAAPGIFEIVEGIAAVKRQDGVTLALLAEGDTFGEMSLLNSFPASADVISVDSCRTICLSPQSLRQITDHHASIAAKLYRRIAYILSRRLRETSRRVPSPEAPREADEAAWWAEHGAVLDGLERAGTAMVIVDRDAGILFKDRRAAALLKDGGGIKAVNGRLVSTDPAAGIVALVKRAADAATTRAEAGSGGVTIERSEGRTPLSVLVTPFRPDVSSAGALPTGALVFIRDPDWIAPAPELLQDLFGLTPTEAAIAAQLAGGAAPEAIADNQGIGLSTVRHHLKNLFSKTGTTRQAELVALVLRSAAPLAG
jgi:DNA-binding CsgD family transcriptional regulator/CRP-like cAMP-binding protein